MMASSHHILEKQWPSLHKAAKNDDIETVKYLLAEGEDVNMRDSKQRTPLHLAAQNGHDETVLALLEAAAGVKTWDSEGKTPLHLAAENGHHETVSALLTADVDVNTQDREQKSPLHLAAKNGHHETVSAFLRAGADVNTQDREQKTPLDLAALNCHHEIVSALLAAGADGNINDSERCPGPTPRKKLRKDDADNLPHPSKPSADKGPAQLPNSLSTREGLKVMQRALRKEREGRRDVDKPLVALTVEHLQCFKNIKTINCHPKTTAIIGPNSSGKTTFLRAWLLFARLFFEVSPGSAGTESFGENHQQKHIPDSVITHIFALSDIKDFWYRRDTGKPVTIRGRDTEDNEVEFIISYELGGSQVKVDQTIHPIPSVMSSKLVGRSHKPVLAVFTIVNSEAYKPQVPVKVPIPSCAVATLDQTLVFSMLYELQRTTYWEKLGEMLQKVRPGCEIRIVSGGRQRGQQVIMVQERSADTSLQICDSGLQQIVAVLVFVLYSLKHFLPSKSGHFSGDSPIATVLLDGIGSFLGREVFKKLVECLTNTTNCQTVVATLFSEIEKECNKGTRLKPMD